MKINRVGLGTYPLAGVFNSITAQDAESLVRKFIAEGGYYIDTAPIYGTGEVEKLLGRVLSSISRDKFYLITKTVKHVDENGKIFKSGKYNDVISQIDNSLQRLKVDYVDLLMVHSPDASIPISETLSALEKLQLDGKVKDIAVSNVNLEELMEYNKTGKIKYIQNRFSLINRSLSPDFENYLLENKIYLIPYHLLEIGMLTGIVLENYTLRSGDLRVQLPYWDVENQKVIFDWVKTSLGPIANKLGISINQLNIAWALTLPFIDFVVVGTTNQKYLKSNLEANNIKLSSSDIQDLNNAYKKLEIDIQTKYGKSIKEFRGLNNKFY